MGPRELGARLAVGKVNVELAANDAEFFGLNVHVDQSLAHGCGGFVPKESDDQLAGLNSLSMGEGVARDDLTHLGDGAKQDGGAESILAFDAGFYFVREGRQAALSGAKDYVATLEMRFDFAELNTHTKRAEVTHFDFVMAADVDATQQANKNRHGGSITREGAKVAGLEDGLAYSHNSSTSILKDGQVWGAPAGARGDV